MNSVLKLRRAFRYVFVNDQGRVFSSQDEPTAEDFARAAVGVFVILRLADLHSYGTRNAWEPIPLGKRATVKIEGVNYGPFHAEPAKRGARTLEGRKGSCYDFK